METTGNRRFFLNTTSKPFMIDKRQVYEAYKAVRSNGSAAGVDGQTIEQFEADLKGNLYKIWNRMSSGSYFPPPVRAVPIPKKAGGQEDIRGTYCERQDRADGGQTADRVGVGIYLPAGLLWLQAGEIGLRCGWSHAPALLEIRLGSEVRH